MYRALSLFLWLMPAGILAQQLYWTQPQDVADASVYGSTRPRVCVAGGKAAVLWSKPGGDLFFSKRENTGAFSEPVKLNPENVHVFAATYGGSDIAARGDDVHVVFMTAHHLEAKLYLVKSADGGTSWSDTLPIPVAPGTIPFLPTLALDGDINPQVAYMEYDSNYENPRWVMVSSPDGGETFGIPASASSGAPHEVCDCCPAHVLNTGDTSVVLFRNNDQNTRDIWVSLSYNHGDSFTQHKDIDPNNWVVSSCPASGPDAVMRGDNITAVWMSAASGNSRVFISEYDPFMDEYTTEQLYTAGTSQNHPRISGSGDTIGVVFQHQDAAQANNQFGFSVTGGGGLGFFQNLGGDSASLQAAPDVFFRDGRFHFVYRDIVSGNVQYRQASFDDLSAVIEKPKAGFSVYPNPVPDRFWITHGTAFSMYRLLDVNGITVLQGNLRNGGLTQVCCDGLAQGVYLLLLSGPDGERVTRIVRQ